MGWAFTAQMGGAVMAKCVTVFLGDMNTGLQGITLSSHHMTMGFGPFELLTCGLL